MKKRIKCGLALIAAFALVFSGVSAAPRQATIDAVFGKTTFTLNGTPLAKDSLLYNGTAYLPAAYLARALGLSAQWDSTSNITNLEFSYETISTNLGNTGELSSKPTEKRINVTFGAPVYYLNGKQLEKECLTYDNEAYLPASYLAETLGLNPTWDASANVTNMTHVPVTSLTVSDAQIGVGEKFSLNATLEPSDATFKTLKYTSKNENVATVSQSGELYGKSAGETVISVMSANGVKKEVKVTVAMNLKAYEAEVVRLVNLERVKEGLLPLSASNETLVLCAEKRADEIIQSFSHTRPDGTSCFTIFDELGLKARAGGENIASGQRTPEAVMKSWMNSEGHKKNILDAKYKQIGVGCAMNENGSLYWVQMFIG